MTQAQIENLPLIADAPDGIKALRGLILDLAVRGKLVPQDSDDEPASELLKRIAAEKIQLVKMGQLKAEKAPPRIADADRVFALPSNWEWVRLGAVAHVVTSGSRDWAKHYSDEGAIFVRMGNLSRGSYQLRLDNIQRVAPPSDGEGTRTKLEAGDVLISITGEVGLLGLIPENFGDAYINQHTCMVRLATDLRNRFVPEFFRSPLAQLQFNAPQRGIKNSFRLTDVTELVLPLPPLAEQRRIVAKVDELMALCDRLEAQQADAEAVHATLVNTLLETLGQSQDTDDFAANWQRLSHHFPISFTTEASVDALKQVVLQLAVMGKLVRQNPDDGQVEDLFDQQGQSELRKIYNGTGEGIPFAVPKSWAWAKLDDLLQAGRGISYGVVQPEKEPASGGVYMLRCSDVKPRHLDLSGARKISEDIDAAYSRTRIKGGEVLINIRGTIGGVALATPDVVGFNIAREVAIIPLNPRICGEYIVDALVSPYFSGIVTENLRGLAYQGINLKSLREFLVPLPPRKEQERIVAKVEELLALCDTLKAQIADSRKVQRQLAVVLVEKTLAA